MDEDKSGGDWGWAGGGDRLFALTCRDPPTGLTLANRFNVFGNESEDEECGIPIDQFPTL